MSAKKLIPCIYLEKGQAIKGLSDKQVVSKEPVELAASYANLGADELLVFDKSVTDEEHEQSIGLLKQMNRAMDIPMIAGGNIKRMEDVKKLLYAGASMVMLNIAKESNVELASEMAARFGKEKMAASITDEVMLKKYKAVLEEHTSLLILLDETKLEAVTAITSLPILVVGDTIPAQELLKEDKVLGISGAEISAADSNLMQKKLELKEQGFSVNTFESAIPFEEFKLNADQMLPVIVQDYKTDEVLMLAYMNKEAYEATLRTGRMTYYSRSRQELWLKGETSGHFQYVKSLTIDCDKDTILAKVMQVGAACHTGNRSCFFTPLAQKEYASANPLKVFEEVYQIISDRKEHPKEGSYTNYLFDKGIDKILKKVGEEATEIVIAAKNPDPEEIKYEIADFLYHAMVLMVEKGVNWEDITEELSKR